MQNNKENITSIEFKNFKALKYYSVKIQRMNILVGPNNSGKSTIISAFRALAIGIRQALSKKASIVSTSDGEQMGYQISEEALPMSLENVHTDYAEIESSINFRLSNGNRLILYFPLTGGCYLLTVTSGKKVTTPKQFKEEFPISLEIVPVLGPIEQNEQVISEETVRKGLTTHRASRHFRNYWRYYPQGFEEFSKLVSKTWPGMTIEPPRKTDMMSSDLVMFCNEDRIARELYWSGFGFQIWCQLLTHISRSKDASIIVVDEPEVYLHPDVQRQLLGILRDSGPDIIIASHSTEIMGEADASEILLINKKMRSAQRLKDIEDIQKAMDAVGSIQNITLTHLARTGRLLFVEGLSDYKILRRFAKQLGLNELSTGNDLTAFECGGFSYWETIRSFAWGFKETLNSSLHIGAVFDKDFRCDEEINNINLELNKHLVFSHIHERKEIENYLLIPKVLDKAIRKAIREREKRTGNELAQLRSVSQILDDITSSIKIDVQSQYLAKRAEYLRNSRLDQATINKQSMEIFEDKWKNIDTRMMIVPGKEVLKMLKAELQSEYTISLTDFKIIDEFTEHDFPNDLCNLLNRLDQFRSII
ncbi:ATP-dependent nuclease [Paenibacillus tengchongensis]|uniref:ATP-dependent nuclease n=1 Tax=Paenibacillus tengchongensis TaxID=2608684 RepID=UPI00124D9CF1|nr:ATP-binding protein [Paenibacillus tengchongensis]